MSLHYNCWKLCLILLLLFQNGGKYDSPTEELIQQCKSVPTTNAEAERDFGMLDRLKKLKPQALDLTIEGIIICQQNKTKNWHDKLSTDALEKVMASARKSKKMQKEQYRKRMAEIQKALVQKMENKEKKKQEKERQLLIQKEQLTNQINEYGGLWSKEVV